MYFDENLTIDNIYRKDFFYEVFHEIVSAESKMFMFNDSETLAWFPSKVRLYILIQENTEITVFNQFPPDDNP